MSKLKYFFFLLFFSFFLFNPLDSHAMTIDLYHDFTKCATCEREVCFYTGSGLCSTLNRISVHEPNYVLQNDSKYELYSTITLGINRSSNLGLRNDFYIGNLQGTTWIQGNTTWNNVDSINPGSNGFYNFLWGSVQSFTSTFSSNGISYDFYFSNPTELNYINVSRFELVNTGSSTNDAINNSTNIIINNNNQNTQNIIDSQNEIKDFLNNDDPPESDISSLGNVQGLLPPGPVDSLLNIPFKFLSIVISSLGDNCTPLSMNWVFDKTLTLPCFSDSFYNNVPSVLMIFINLIPSGFILITYFKYLYKKVNRAVSLETTSDDEWGVL